MKRLGGAWLVKDESFIYQNVNRLMEGNIMIL